MGKIEWVVEENRDDDDRPIYGPPCPGFSIHKWAMIIEEGSVMLGSGCAECDRYIEVHEIVAEFFGHLSFEHEHGDGGCPNAIRMLPCDCNYWYRFEIERQI